MGTSSKRPGEPLETLSDKGQRPSQNVDETSVDVSLADSGVPSWGDKTIRLDVNSEEREHAIQFPTAGWPNFENAYAATAGNHLTHECFDAKPRGKSDPNAAYKRKWGVGPVSIALHEAGVPQVDRREFRMMDGEGKDTPLLPLGIRTAMSTNCLNAEFECIQM